jgi:hypothetical protein
LKNSNSPLGLLPVQEFPAQQLTIETGDLVVIATGGILEGNSSERTKHGVGFGVEELEKLVAGHTSIPLPELAALILQAVCSYRKQSMLLVRRRVHGISASAFPPVLKPNEVREKFTKTALRAPYK